MKIYAANQGRTLDDIAIIQAMHWSDPARDVRVAKERALFLMFNGNRVHCAWSNKILTPENIDIDHCFPWSAWPCDDLWNLLPSNRVINQHKKRDKLPSASTLLQAAASIKAWWDDAYLTSCNANLSQRFELEAKSTLPGIVQFENKMNLANLFQAVNTQRIRLRHDQQIPEWTM